MRVCLYGQTLYNRGWQKQLQTALASMSLSQFIIVRILQEFSILLSMVLRWMILGPVRMLHGKATAIYL